MTPDFPFIGYDPDGLMGRPIVEGWLAAMRLDDSIRKTVLYVGRAKKGPFQAEGTGFITVTFEGPHAFQQLVTAKHVIDGIPGDMVDLRLNRLDGTAQVIETPKEHWIPHPDPNVDLAICPSMIPKDQFDIQFVDVDDTSVWDLSKNPNAIGIGDEVYIPGMFIARMGEAKNIPILRTGTIAAMPEEKIKTQYGYHDAYLIEARSIDGLSGSPVWAFTALMQINKDKKIVPTPVLAFAPLGVLLGHHQVLNPRETIEIQQTKGRRRKSPKEAGIPLNTGIGVVLPLAAVREAIHQEHLIKARREAVERKENQTRRFVSDSVSKGAAVVTSADAKSDNPAHKEDFRSLLTEAAKTRTQGD